MSVHKTGGRALLVDDDQFVRKVTSLQLQFLGFEVVEAGAADVAIAALRSMHEAGDPPQLLLTDWHMPGPIDGAEFVARVQQHYPQLRCVVMTGDRDLQLSVETLHKPVNLDALRALLP